MICPNFLVEVVEIVIDFGSKTPFLHVFSSHLIRYGTKIPMLEGLNTRLMLDR